MDTAWFMSTVLLVISIILALLRAFLGYMEAYLVFYSATMTVEEDAIYAARVGLQTECLSTGATLWSPRVIDPAKPRILFLHGNSCCLGTLSPFFRLFMTDYNIFALDYRGFGKAAASRSCAFSAATICTIDADTWEAWRVMVSRGPSSMINIVAGHSLGGAIAVDLVARILTYPHLTACLDQLVLMHTFSSYSRLVHNMMGAFSACLPLGIKWDSVVKLCALQTRIRDQMFPRTHSLGFKPIVILHSRDDNLISFDHAIELANAFAECPELVELVELPSGSKCSKICLELEPRQQSAHACAVLAYKQIWQQFVIQ